MKISRRSVFGWLSGLAAVFAPTPFQAKAAPASETWDDAWRSQAMEILANIREESYARGALAALDAVRNIRLEIGDAFVDHPPLLTKIREKAADRIIGFYDVDEIRAYEGLQTARQIDERTMMEGLLDVAETAIRKAAKLS